MDQFIQDNWAGDKVMMLTWMTGCMGALLEKNDDKLPSHPPLGTIKPLADFYRCTNNPTSRLVSLIAVTYALYASRDDHHLSEADMMVVLEELETRLEGRSQFIILYW